MLSTGLFRCVFQSTLPVWGATIPPTNFGQERRISIHAPRVGSDPVPPPHRFHPHHFNPRSPCGERPSASTRGKSSSDFNPRSPCGERRRFHVKFGQGHYFNPRSPCGERQFVANRLAKRNSISIHAPRVGSDGLSPQPKTEKENFNPRSPCGERRLTRRRNRMCWPGFQSTLPVWGATESLRLAVKRKIDFNPRSPCGERPAAWTGVISTWAFQSTLPVWGATGTSDCASRGRTYFNPRSPCGERRRDCLILWICALNFNPRSPCGERRMLPREHPH